VKQIPSMACTESHKYRGNAVVHKYMHRHKVNQQNTHVQSVLHSSTKTWSPC